MPKAPLTRGQWISEIRKYLIDCGWRSTPSNTILSKVLDELIYDQPRPRLGPVYGEGEETFVADYEIGYFIHGAVENALGGRIRGPSWTN
jgi:hypothetical protein